MNTRTASDPVDVPTGALIALGGLIAATLVAVAVVQFSGVGQQQLPDADVVATRALTFVDRRDGGIDIIDARDGSLASQVDPGTQGFLRGTMRGLARERRSHGIGAERPFQLRSLADGRLLLEDPDTGRRIDLGSFGPDNAAVFAALVLPPPAAAR
jgi:putative photosynthetic complex assembly protein